MCPDDTAPPIGCQATSDLLLTEQGVTKNPQVSCGFRSPWKPLGSPSWGTWAWAARFAPVIKLGEPEVQGAAGTILLARDRAGRGESAQCVWVDPEVPRRFARREPSIAITAGFGDSERDTGSDPIGKRVEEVIDHGRVIVAGAPQRAPPSWRPVSACGL